jgi:hypothetical protein
VQDCHRPGLRRTLATPVISRSCPNPCPRAAIWSPGSRHSVRPSDRAPAPAITHRRLQAVIRRLLPIGGPRGTRTHNPRIKRPQLPAAYAPTRLNQQHERPHRTPHPPPVDAVSRHEPCHADVGSAQAARPRVGRAPGVLWSAGQSPSVAQASACGSACPCLAGMPRRVGSFQAAWPQKALTASQTRARPVGGARARTSMPASASSSCLPKGSVCQAVTSA